MQFIEDHEETPRRWYGGAVGKIGFDGSMNTGLTLRTAHITGGIAAVRAGATLLYDSIPEAEEARDPHQGPRPAGDAGRGRAGRIAGASGSRPDRGGGRGTSGAGDYPDRRRPAMAARRPGPAGGPPGLVRAHPGATTSASTAPRSPRCGSGSRPALLDSYAPDLVVLSPGPGRPVGLRLRGAARRGVRARACRPSASAWACRPWWSTPAESCRCCPSRRTASPGWSRWPGERPAGRAARRVHRRPVPQPVRAGRGGPRRIHRHRRHARRRGDGDRGRAGRPLGGAVPPRVDPDRVRPVRPPDHRQRPGRGEGT